MNEPKKIRAGDTITWNEVDGNYPAPTWSLAYALRGPSALDVSGTTSGSGHTVTIAAADSAKLVPGIYSYTGSYSTGTGTGLVRATPDDKIGTLEVLQNLSAIAGPIDARTTLRRTFDAIEATLEGRASKEQSAMSIGGRQIAYLTPSELITAYKRLKRMLALEEQREKIAKGQDPGNAIEFRFTTP